LGGGLTTYPSKNACYENSKNEPRKCEMETNLAVFEVWNLQTLKIEMVRGDCLSRPRPCMGYSAWGVSEPKRCHMLSSNSCDALNTEATYNLFVFVRVFKLPFFWKALRLRYGCPVRVLRWLLRLRSGIQVEAH
jgi:hypothetical protein